MDERRMKTFNISIYSYVCIFVCISFFFLIRPYTNPLSKTPEKVHVSTFTHEYENCDLFNGHWIRDWEQPFYTDTSCPTIPEPRNCFKNGRVDTDFLKWRWKPDACELPRVDAKLFLQNFRGKSMAFIGDSVARNHMESLHCLLSQEETPVNIYEDSEDRILRWHFPDHDFTLTVLWSKFLVKDEEIIINNTNTGHFRLHIDKIGEEWYQNIPSTLDYAIISSGHWFIRKLYLYKDGALLGCVSCHEPNIDKFDFGFALRMSIRTALNYIADGEKFKGTTTVLRTYSPAHFENGKWNTGGNCNSTSPFRDLDGNAISLYNESMTMRGVQVEEMERATKTGLKDRRFEALDVTKAMLMRADGHPDSHYGKVWMKGYHDCLHWCLPGPIDAWNDLLFAVLFKENSYKFI